MKPAGIFTPSHWFYLLSGGQLAVYYKLHLNRTADRTTSGTSLPHPFANLRMQTFTDFLHVRLEVCKGRGNFISFLETRSRPSELSCHSTVNGSDNFLPSRSWNSRNPNGLLWNEKKRVRSYNRPNRPGLRQETLAIKFTSTDKTKRLGNKSSTCLSSIINR